MAIALLLGGCGGEEAAAPMPAATTAEAPPTAATLPATGAGSPGAAGIPGAPDSTTAIRVANTSLGKVIVDNDGKTLYVFENDPPSGDRSVCNGNCAALWRPAIAPASGEPTKGADVTGTIKVFNRDDGTKQISYNGLPLYRYAPDTAAGETKGEGVGGTWTVARP